MMSKRESDYKLGRCFRHNDGTLVVQERRRLLRSGGFAKFPNFVVLIKAKAGDKFEDLKVGQSLKGIGLSQLIKTNFKEV